MLEDSRCSARRRLGVKILSQDDYGGPKLQSNAITTTVILMKVKNNPLAFDKRKNSNYSIFRHFRTAPEGGLHIKKESWQQKIKAVFSLLT